MNEIMKIADNISYLPASEEPLSADIGIVEGEKALWLFDLGNSNEALETIRSLKKPVNAVVSHFHPDHLGNLKKFSPEKVYLGANTFSYANCGEVVAKDIYIEDGIKIHIFPLPSCHAKGSLGLEAGDYAFLGDGTYTARKDGRFCYNTSILKEEIEVLKGLEAKYFLLSHDEKFIYKKEEVIAGLEEIYSKRDPKESYIFSW